MLRAVVRAECTAGGGGKQEARWEGVSGGVGAREAVGLETREDGAGEREGDAWRAHSGA